MRLILAMFAVAGALLVGPTAHAQTAHDVDPAVEQCLRANAARVSTSATSLTDAADFLLNNVCIVEISAAAARVQQERFDRMRARMCANNRPTAAALQSDPGDDADTAAYLTAYCAQEGDWTGESVALLSAAATALPADRALAAQLLLEARERR